MTTSNGSVSAAEPASDHGSRQRRRMPKFLPPSHSLTIEEIANLTGAKPREGDPLDRRIENIAPLDTALAVDISFLDSAKYLTAFATTHAGACFVSPRFASSV